MTENSNPFKKLGKPDKEVPVEMKEKVMNDVGTAKLFMELSSLFTSNYGEAIESLFRTNKKKNN